MSLLALFALVPTASASPATELVDGFLDAASAGDRDALLGACSDGFRARPAMSCTELVDLIVGGATVERARFAEDADEALAELWLTTRGERLPLVLLAKPTDDGWRFVDGTDVDGPALQTGLTLGAVPDPGAVELPKSVAKALASLGSPKLVKHCVPEARDRCRGIAEEIRGKGIEVRPLAVRAAAARLVVDGVGGPEGQRSEPVHLYFERAGKNWLLVEIDDDDARAGAWLRK